MLSFQHRILRADARLMFIVRIEGTNNILRLFEDRTGCCLPVGHEFCFLIPEVVFPSSWAIVFNHDVEWTRKKCYLQNVVITVRFAEKKKNHRGGGEFNGA